MDKAYQLYHGDSMEILKTVKADCIVTDPPYKLVGGGNKGREMGGCFAESEYDNSGSIVDCDIDWTDFMPLLFDCLNDRSHAFVMCNNRHVQNMLNSAESAGFKFHNLLVWDKVAPTPNRWFMKNCEFIGFFYKGKAKYINDCGSKQLIRMQQKDVSKHPTEKPVPLMEFYIRNSTQNGDIVIDPFMGSGTTGVAAIQSGRKFIGIESNKKWFDVAKQRIEKTKIYAQDNLSVDTYQSTLL